MAQVDASPSGSRRRRARAEALGRRPGWRRCGEAGGSIEYLTCRRRRHRGIGVRGRPALTARISRNCPVGSPRCDTVEFERPVRRASADPQRRSGRRSDHRAAGHRQDRRRARLGVAAPPVRAVWAAEPRSATTVEQGDLQSVRAGRLVRGLALAWSRLETHALTHRPTSRLWAVWPRRPTAWNPRRAKAAPRTLRVDARASASSQCGVRAEGAGRSP